MLRADPQHLRPQQRLRLPYVTHTHFAAAAVAAAAAAAAVASAATAVAAVGRNDAELVLMTLLPASRVDPPCNKP